MVKPEDHDYPMSQDYREFVSGVQGKRTKQKHPSIGRVIGKRKIAGITINVTEGAPDQGSFPAIEENLVRMGVYPKKEAPTTPASTPGTSTPTPEKATPITPDTKHTKAKKEKVIGRVENQDDFFAIVPEFQFNTPPKDPEIVAANKEARLGKVHTRAQNKIEEERIKVTRPDAGHDETVWQQNRRKNLGLPEEALPFKDRLTAIKALTPEDLTIIKEVLEYNPDRIHQYAPLTQEIILHRLHEYKEWLRKQKPKV